MTSTQAPTDVRTGRQAYYAEYRKRDHVMEANRRAQAERYRRLTIVKLATKLTEMTHDEIMEIFNCIFTTRHVDFASKRAELDVIATIIARPVDALAAPIPGSPHAPAVDVPATEP